jgi:hypothetical protein
MREQAAARERRQYEGAPESNAPAGTSGVESQLNMTFPCPHNRELTDDELNRIAARGLVEWLRAEQEKQRQRDESLPGDEWKEQ